MLTGSKGTSPPRQPQSCLTNQSGTHDLAAMARAHELGMESSLHTPSSIVYMSRVCIHHVSLIRHRSPRHRIREAFADGEYSIAASAHTKPVSSANTA